MQGWNRSSKGLTWASKTGAFSLAYYDLAVRDNTQKFVILKLTKGCIIVVMSIFIAENSLSSQDPFIFPFLMLLTIKKPYKLRVLS